MFPDLLSLGTFHLHTYGACMALGLLLAWTLVERLSGRRDLSSLVVTLMCGGIAGSRLAYVIEHWTAEFAARPVAVLEVWNGGLMFYGGFLAAVILFFVWCAVRRENPLPLADLLCLALPLAHACGRLGCFFYGCCYGRLSESLLAVSFPAHSPAWCEQYRAGLIPASAVVSRPVLPTQLFEAAALLLLFAALFFLHRRLRMRDVRPGFVTGSYFIGYAVLRFGLEYLRGDPRAEVLGVLSISQTISLGLFLSGLAVLLARIPRHGKR